MAHEITEENIKAGQAVYTAVLLKIYNLLVLNISNNWIWRCPKRYQLEQYRKLATDNHLDIGVGTGYYLKQNTWPKNTKLALMDPNPLCLAAAKKAAGSLLPQTYQADIFKTPEANLSNRFKSVSMNYLLHCLPGNLDDKAITITHAVAMLKPGGILFGATILSDENLQTGMSKRLAAFYNKKKIFSNIDDNYQTLKQILEANLSHVDIKIMGCVALFSGYKPELV